MSHQTDIESQQQEQLNTEEEDIDIGTSHQSTERWEVVDEYLNESQTQDDINVTNDSNSEEEGRLSGLQMLRSVASNMLSLRSIPMTTGASRRSSIIQAVVTRRPRSRSMVETHSSRTNESASQRRASLPARPRRNTHIQEQFSEIVLRRRRVDRGSAGSAGLEALRDLSQIMGAFSAVEACVVDDTTTHTETVDAVPVATAEMERDRKWRRFKRRICLSGMVRMQSYAMLLLPHY